MDPQKKRATTQLPSAYSKVNSVFVRRNAYFLLTVQPNEGRSYTNKHNKIMQSGLPGRRRLNEYGGEKT